MATKGLGAKKSQRRKRLETNSQLDWSATKRPSLKVTAVVWLVNELCFIKKMRFVFQFRSLHNLR